MRLFLHRPTGYAVIALVAALVGALMRGYLPPFVLDDPFWREFWSGPPAAGIFALLGAGIAFGAAAITVRTARRNALRDQWWERAEWALTQVMSTNPTTVAIGLAALEVLNAEATPTEGDMIAAVTKRRVLDNAAPGVVDTEPLAEGQ